MMKYTPDFSSRFRILKGGKISLVVSALLSSGFIVSSSHAATVEIPSGTGMYSIDGSNPADDYHLASGNDLMITGTDTGIKVLTAPLSTNITNEATVSVSWVNGFNIGIYPDQGIASTGSIVNSGTVSVSSTNNTYGIFASRKTYGTITNNEIGTITAESTANAAAGAWIGNLYGSGALINNGTITADGSSYAHGIYVSGSMLGTITNSATGLIEATSTTDYARGIHFGSGMEAGSELINSGTIGADGNTKAYGINMYSSMHGSITNNQSGVIEARSTNDNAYGIYSSGKMENDSSIVNSGTIRATSTNSNAYGVNVGSQMYGMINNSGSIEANGITAKGISVGSLADDSSTQSVILNDTTGQINVTANGFGAGIQVTGAPAINGVDYYTMLNSSIENAGTISVTLNADVERANVTAYGIHVNPDDYKIKDSTITNSGTINVQSNFVAYEVGNVRLSGIEVANAEIDGLTITNSGAISIANAITGSYDRVYWNYTYVNGIKTDGSTATGLSIINSGSGDTNGIHIDTYSEATGINVETFDVANSNINTTITNSGTIDIKSDREAYGIRVDGEFDPSLYYMRGLQITNSGTISAVSRYSDAYGISASVLGSTYDGETNNTSFITNSGTISATSNGGNTAYGIRVGLMSDDSLITNSGTITAISLDNGGRAFGIDVNTMSGTSQITNTLGHTITVNGSERGVGIRVGQDMAQSSFINNAGTITVNSVSEANGMDISQMSGTTSIANTGTINVNNSDGESGYNATGITVWNADASAGITNSGTIRASVGGTMDQNGAIVDGVMSASAFSVYSAGSGTLFNLSNGKMYGNLKYMGTVNNYGTISLPHNANGDLSGTVGTFVNKSTGILEIGLQTDGTTTTHSQLQTNNATFENGSTISVNVLAASTNVALIQGTTLQDVVSASNSLTINGTLNVTDNSALLNFEHVVDGNTIDLNIVEGTTIFDSTVTGGGNTNTQSAATALQTINDDAVNHPAMSGYIAALNTLSTDAEVAHAVASTTPVSANASVTANTQIMNGVQGIVEMRQNSVMGGGMNSGDLSLSDKNLWVKLYGSRGTQDNKDGINGFDVKAYGFGMGADAEIAPKQRIGAAFFYTGAKVDVNNMPQTSDLKVYTAMLYGNLPMNVNTDFLYQAGYSWQKTESDRTILPTYDHAKADYTSTTASIDLKVMQTYKINSNIDVRPLIEGTYRYFTNPSYSESGAGAMNLHANKFTSSQFITSGGTIIDYKLDQDSKLITDLRLGYDWHHDAQTVTASYQGASGVNFTTNGIDNGGWQYDIGVGYETTKVLGGEFNFMYNYQGQGSSFDNHVVSAKYVYKF